MVSGVFYAAMPKQAGPILFRDPRWVIGDEGELLSWCFLTCFTPLPPLPPCRGPLPPFDTPLTIQPQVGDLLLFPSWLPHEVAATACDEPRISIAFNMPGSWQDTSASSAQFPLER